MIRCGVVLSFGHPAIHEAGYARRASVNASCAPLCCARAFGRAEGSRFWSFSARLRVVPWHLCRVGGRTVFREEFGSLLLTAKRAKASVSGVAAYGARNYFSRCYPGLTRLG